MNDFEYSKTSFYTDDEPVIGRDGDGGADADLVMYHRKDEVERTRKTRGTIPRHVDRVLLPPRCKFYNTIFVTDNKSDRKKWTNASPETAYEWVVYAPFDAPPPLDLFVSPVTYTDAELVGPMSLPAKLPFNLPYYKETELERDYLVKLL